MHKVKIEPIEEFPTCSRISIDGNYIRCSGYNITHYAGHLPVIELELFVVPNCEQDMIVEVGNKEYIAKLMDKTEFAEFCNIWNEVHRNDRTADTEQNN